MPSIRNVLVNPEISLSSDEAFGDGRRATLRTTGLMCSSLGVARVHSALEGLQGVSKVEFLTAPDRYVVDYDPAQVGYEDFVRTFNSQVAGRMFRGMLGKLGGEQSSTLSDISI